ncbi:MAG: hypothetical protein EZS28_006281 [Streblomastix strix]|uniref:Uncharacterized protein n=1 Tax=Streblomastix strix TaxID=222440 RepID=A0A5J4WT98_9EUKA|nr:MAG: hypothetical protein EZS28_006281 [Streblomastix strix]
MSIIRSHKKLLSKFSIPQNAPIPSYSFLPLSTSNQLTNTSISQQKSSPIFPIHLRGSCGNKYFTVISNYQPIAVDPVITEGIVYFEAAIQGLNKINDESVGIMDSSITFIPESTPRNQSPNQTVFYSGQKGQIEHMEREVNGNAQFLCDQRIGAEVDMDSTPRTLHFFVEDVEQPIFVVGIPAAIRFFVSISQQGSSFKVSKFERRYHSTAKGVHGSKSFEYGKKWNDPNRNIYNDFNLPPVIDQFKTNFGYQDDQSKIDQNRIKSIDPILIESKEQDCKVEENTIIHTQYNYNYCLTTFNPIIQSRNGIFRFETVFKNHKSESFSVGIVNSTECFERNQLAPKKKGAAVYYSSKFGEVYNLVSNNKIEGNSAFFCGSDRSDCKAWCQAL